MLNWVSVPPPTHQLEQQLASEIGLPHHLGLVASGPGQVLLHLILPLQGRPPDNSADSRAPSASRCWGDPTQAPSASEPGFPAPAPAPASTVFIQR